MSEVLLTRDKFRELVFVRDSHLCVNCGAPARDVHHIIERRLFFDGGYYLDNGVSVCEACHLEAEATLLSCRTLREKAGIQLVVLPPEFEANQECDKWGNPILPNGLRLRGPLFDNPSVRRTLNGVLHLFTRRVKYPRTFHLPWSPGATDDDKVLATTEHWIGTEVVITEKMDGEGTTIYNDYMHPRSMEYTPAVWRDRIRAIHGEIAHEIPEGWRICGENVTAKHSIGYDNLEDWFLVFSIWDEMTCLSWDEVIEWCALLGVSRASGRALRTVPVLYRGVYTEEVCRNLCVTLDQTKQEGLVVRPAGRFHFKEFSRYVGKFVRAGHVQTTQHWTREEIKFNEVVK